MGSFMWALIVLAAIVGGYIIDYQKNKMKWQTKSSRTEDDLDEMRTLLHQMKKRIENLEAIAAADPEEFSSGSKRDPLQQIEIDDEESIKEENRRSVSNKAKKQR
ncbi:hypothetical protein [Rhodohalobacter halophilus]|uniref:hypothetical protein n=1 Tax=Rhodohalobacter halophilus TaxID=1812810 RepID=UPI00114D2E76|nr:hypothetical protein [Rhodohalobacter halophilus]